VPECRLKKLGLKKNYDMLILDRSEVSEPLERQRKSASGKEAMWIMIDSSFGTHKSVVVSR